MYARVKTAALHGIDAYIVDAEVDILYKLPSFTIVGLPDNAIKESRERVTSAIKNSGFPFPQNKVTVNLAPANIRKEGSSFDLPIAIGILAASGYVSTDALDRFIIVGEIGLDGTVLKTRGVLPVAVAARKYGAEGLIVPKDNVQEAAVADVDAYPVSNIRDVIEILEGKSSITPFKLNIRDIFNMGGEQHYLDFKDVRGQESAKRALEIAAAGAHNILMIGPPGSGKTMLARRFPGILPTMTLEEALETTKIHSVAGILPPNVALLTTRPFRSPHHTISDAGLVGGGAYPKPGEVSLAHNGVLFLDELPEFQRNVLEVMRQPLEDGVVTIARAAITLSFPSRFMLVAAMNPCPCGYYGDPYHECTCTITQVRKYRAKISGPLLDRIDMHIEVPSVRYEKLAGEPTGESTEEIRARVMEARLIQQKRFEGIKNVYANAHMTTKLIRRFCKLSPEGENILKQAITRMGLSARAYDRVLKVSRTIADLENSESIEPYHIAEAVQYRSLDREYWA
ncbi:YifB family Mg chelatase-like AAA ATPase [bacterium]|nr:YifB family Mg chelatase-like AAA ATPase [bacterium]